MGLGNVGLQYQDTRHNAGWMVVQALGRKHRVAWRKDTAALAATYGEWKVRSSTIRLMMPHTMMNQSGEAVHAAVRRWRLAPEELLIVLDDVSLPLGTLRLRSQGSDGGHHGLASCLEALETQDVTRLRIGVGLQPLPKKLTDFVLSPFRTQERPVIRQAVARAVEACELWATTGVEVAMNQINPSQVS